MSGMFEMFIEKRLRPFVGMDLGLRYSLTTTYSLTTADIFDPVCDMDVPIAKPSMS